MPTEAPLFDDFHPEMTRVWSEPLGLDYESLRI
jgi:hypothetical protein